MKRKALNIACLVILIATGFSSLVYAEDVKTKPDSLLKRLVDSYVNSSKTDQTLKHLLDAKMYLSSAEHDLLVSHNKKSAQRDIENTLSYLVEAEGAAKPETKAKIIDLINRLKLLETKTMQEKVVGQDSQVDQLLSMAQVKLIDAQKSTDISASTKKRIDEINSKLQELRNQIEHANLREDYEAAMNTLNSIIHGL